MWLPFAAEVGYEIDGKLIDYFQCQIVDWQTGTK